MNKSSIINFVLIVLVTILVFDKLNRPPSSDGEPVVDTVFVTRADTVYKYIAKGVKPEPIFVKTVDTIEVYVPKPTDDGYETFMDSLARRYYSKFYYSEEYNGEDVDVWIDDVVTENNILIRDIRVKNLREAYVATITLPAKQRNKVFVGGGVTLNPQRIGYELNAYLVNRHDQMFGLSYDFPNEQIEFSAAFKLKFRK